MTDITLSFPKQYGSMRIIFGGTFNPFHSGHLISAVQLSDLPDVEAVHLVVSGNPPHKDDTMVPAEIRLRMVDESITGFPKLKSERIEIDRPGPSFAIDTVRELQSLYPECQFKLAHGTDAISELHLWHQPRELLQLVQLQLIARPGFDYSDLSPLREICLPAQFEMMRSNIVKSSEIALSSTELRRRRANGLTIDPWVPSAVAKIIKEYNLYST
jgi:nicotinate-nucleotide adenylyltransferase